MIIDLHKIDTITPKGCHVFMAQIMPSLRDLNACTPLFYNPIIPSGLSPV